MGRFSGKVAIVSGSSSGIGRAVAVLLGREGARVTIHGLPGARAEDDSLELTRSALLEAQVREEDIHEVSGDITEEAVCRALVEETVAKFGHLDILINNAGGLSTSRTQLHITCPLEHFDRMIDLNVKSMPLRMIRIVQFALPHLEKSQGEIVNVSSITARPFANQTHTYYSLSKAAVEQLTVQLAGNLIQKGIRVNAVAPGQVQTNFAVNSGGTTEGVNQHYSSLNGNRQRIPIGRPAQAEDVAKVIAFLADRNQSEFVIGERIAVDGGSLLMNCDISAQRVQIPSHN